MAAPSYDAGEKLRVTIDGNNTLRVHHGATEIATLKSILGGAVKLEADGRTWRLTRTDDGWTATGDPPASLAHRALRSDRLTIGAHEYGVKARSVTNVLRLRVDKSGRRPELRGEILQPPPPGADAHATIALATAALLLGADLSVSAAHSEINGDNRSAAIHYGAPHV